MDLKNIFEITTAILASFGGGAVIVVALSKWLGGLWASRILESEQFKHRLEQDLIARRRDIYAELATALRVFLKSSTPSSEEDKAKFLQAHDEAFLWASEEVAFAIGAFLDLQMANTANPNSIPMPLMHISLHNCLTVMRKDVGFPETQANYRIVSF